MKKNNKQLSTSSPIQFEVTIERRRHPLTVDDGSASNAATGAQSKALAAWSDVNNSCSAAITTVNQNPLGPYGDNGSCDYDCSYNLKWSWKKSYLFINNKLIQVISVMNAGNAYNGAFQSAQNWVENDLPNFGAKLTGDLTSIAQIDEAIIADGGNETPEQRIQMDAAFADASGVLKNNLSEADLALQSIATFLTSQNGNVGYLQNMATNEQTYIKQDATKTEADTTGKMACGADDVRSSFNAMFANVAAKFVNMQTPFDNVNTNFESALKEVELVAGIFLHLQPDNELVSKYLSQARAYPPTSPLRKMHLNMATNVWNGFVSEANTQLGGG